MDRPNANMVTSSFDRIQGSYAQPVYQPYNNFRIQNLGGNIIQGQLNKLSVTELMFPYSTPTIVNAQNGNFYIGYRDISGNGDIGELLDVFFFQLDERFYSGSELVDALNGLTSTDIGYGPPTPMANIMTWEWDPIANSIAAVSATTWDSGTGGFLHEFFPFGVINQGSPLTPIAPQAILRNPFNYPSFFWTAGFRNNFATNPAVPWPVYINPGFDTEEIEFNIVSSGVPANIPLPSTSYGQIIGAFYTGRYTDFIDIVSSTLCQAQYIRDTTTSQNTTRRDVIARVYICNNISVVSLTQEGSRPFIIHRLFPVPKVMKWTADRSIDAIDLQLFDMYGQPLPNGQSNSLSGPPNGKFSIAGEADYAITFHVHEPRADTQEENIGYSYTK